MMFGKKYVWQPTAISSGAAVALVTGLSVTVLVGAAPAAQARNVFLNGVDVSSSRSQELRNVQVRINEKGDIFLSAPHYQVTEEDFFTPLSRLAPSQMAPNSIPAAEAPPVAAAPTAASSSAAAGSPAALASPKAPDKRAEKVLTPVAKPEDLPSGSFANSNIAAAKSGPESMPPVLNATPPATGTTPQNSTQSPVSAPTQAQGPATVNTQEHVGQK